MCKQCETNSVYQFTNKRKLCGKCFVKWVQKKFLYIIRKFKMIKKDDIIGCKNDGDFRDVVLEYLLKIFESKLIINLIKFQAKKKNNKVDKIALSSTIDLEADKIVHALIKDKTSDLKKVFPIVRMKNQIIIKPLYLFLDNEIIIYAKLKGLKFKKIKEKKDKISEFIYELEKKHPEIKRAIVKSYLELH